MIELNDLSDLPVATSLSEIHGVLCGMLCIRDINAAEWLRHGRREFGNGHDFGPQTHAAWLALLQETTRQLDDDELGFMLLLPDDDTHLPDRVEQLSDWCRGFLFGLTLCGLGEQPLVPAVQEFMHDVTQIARAGFDNTDNVEDDEQAYAEIVEYLRVGVMLTYRELRSGTASSLLH